MATTPIEDLEQRISQAIGPNKQEALSGILNSLREISEAIYRNPITGAPGPRQLDVDVTSIRAPKDNQDIYVVMLDIDDFGDFNKLYGESVGNTILTGVTRIIGETLRSDDVVLRISKDGTDYHLHGEEMLVLYVCKNLKDAVSVSERIVSQVAHRAGQETKYNITVSAGITRLNPNEDFNDAKARADRYMQFAKQEGKNRTYTADECRDPFFKVKSIFYKSGVVDCLARKVPKAIKLAKGIVGRTATDLTNRFLNYVSKT